MSLEQIRQVLDMARWSPSGDNTQPWRFEIVDERQVVVHGHDTRADCVYDLRGEASQLSIGAMLQTLEIAASAQGWSTEIRRRSGLPDDAPAFDVQFTDKGIPPDALLPFIKQRAVQRRPMRTQALSKAQRASMERSAGAGYRICWLEGLRGRWRASTLLFRNAGLRLTLPEAFEVHRRIIEWDAVTSEDRIPDRALGASPLTLKLMRWGLVDWQRVHFANRFLMGTWAPRIELDLIPGMACAAHIAIVAPRVPAGIDDMVEAGKAVQRVWLTATQLGLWQQPEMTPLIFARYARQKLRFSSTSALIEKANDLARRLDGLLGEHEASRAIWLGRLGTGPAPTARSTRLPLDQLLVADRTDQKYQTPRT